MKTDAELCAAYRSGDEGAFDELYGRYAPRLRVLSKARARRFPPPLNADDAFSEGALMLWRIASSAEALDRDGSIARHLDLRATGAMVDAVRSYTHRGRLINVSCEDSPEQVTASVDLGDLEAKANQLKRLEVALSALSEVERTVVTEYHLSGLTLREIGARFGLSESWACCKLRDAMRRLKAIASGDTVKVGSPPDTKSKSAKISHAPAWRQEFAASEAARKRGVEVMPRMEAAL